MSLLQVVDSPLDLLGGDAAAAFFFDDERPPTGPASLIDWRLNGPLTDLLVGGRATGRAGERVLIRGNGKIAAPWALFVGGGSWYGLGEETYRGLLRHMAECCREAGFGRVALALDAPEGMDPAAIPRWAGEILGKAAPGIEWCLGRSE